MRSFGIVEDKIKETDFFLSKLEESTRNQDFFLGARFYLSAFTSASRSITFSLQAAMKGIPDFKNWYEQHQNILKQNDLAKYFVEVRNLSQKVGYYPLSSGRIFRDEENQIQVQYFFDYFLDEKIDGLIPKDDVITACKKYFVLLLELISDCFKTFGYIIDPVEYFVYIITAGGKSFDDIEEELGFPRKWTDIEGILYEERVKMLRHHFEKDVTIDYVFEKYLGTNRFGDKII